jgi:tRNA (cytidine32/uridine32-2'-O)-methyltransferase
VGNETAQNIAILFGRERSGLSNLELQRCHYHITIPTDPGFSSLNLAAAVQVIAYELYAFAEHNTAKLSYTKSEESLASEQEVERFYQHLQQTLIDLRFLNPEQPKLLMLRLRRLFQRAKLQQQEVNILRGICRAAQEGKSYGEQSVREPNPESESRSQTRKRIS